MIGRESLPLGSVDDDLLVEAESLAAAAMRPDDHTPTPSSIEGHEKGTGQSRSPFFRAVPFQHHP
jgi:hypothetical protein